MMLRIETDRGYGWQVRCEGQVPADISAEKIKAETMRCALNGRARAFLDGKPVFECKKLTAKQAREIFGL